MRFVSGLVLALMITGFAAAEEPRNRGIESAISSQISAFLKDDFETAFTYAGPGIKRIFQTPERFGQMVKQGYPMVWRPERVEFLSLEDFNGQLIQRVLIEDAKGTYYIAEYAMLETESGWQIRAVRISLAKEMLV